MKYYCAPKEATAKCPVKDNLSEQTTISLMTCGSGESLYSMFGHSALWVYDPLWNPQSALPSLNITTLQESYAYQRPAADALEPELVEFSDILGECETHG